MSVILCCPKHRAYMAKRYPTSGCETCLRMWALVANFRTLKSYVLRWAAR